MTRRNAVDRDLTLLIPLWNEAGNIDALIDELKQHCRTGRIHAILIDNGATDATGALIDAAVRNDPDFLSALHLPANLGYGGAIRAGIDRAASGWVCWIPGDLQVLPHEVMGVFENGLAEADGPSVIKGQRVFRADGPLNAAVSFVYTQLGRLLFGLWSVRDLNALPKIFPTELAQRFPADMRSGFVFDAEALFLARRAGYRIREYPVGWYKRFSGRSSWAHRPMAVYLETLVDLFRLRLKRRHASLAPPADCLSPETEP